MFLLIKGIYAKAQNDTIEPVEDADNEQTELLSKAATCLYKAILLSKPSNSTNNTEAECYANAMVSLVYTKLEINDSVGVLELCQVINNEDADIFGAKRRSILKLYAAEANCRLGDAKTALILMYGSDEIDEAKLKEDASSDKSPFSWIAQILSSKGKASDGSFEDAKIQNLVQNRLLLYQTLKMGDTETAVDIIRGGELALDHSQALLSVSR